MLQRQRTAPTCGLNTETYFGHIKTLEDALTLLAACELGLLPRVRRRLTARECEVIRSGSIFVWEEEEAGIRRWTDGMSWSASRVSGGFITYQETEGKRVKTGTSASAGHKQKCHGFTKLSYSIITSRGLHMHLISYYSPPLTSSSSLIQPSHDPLFRYGGPNKDLHSHMALYCQTENLNSWRTSVETDLSRPRETSNNMPGYYPSGVKMTSEYKAEEWANSSSLPARPYAQQRQQQNHASSHHASLEKYTNQTQTSNTTCGPGAFSNSHPRVRSADGGSEMSRSNSLPESSKYGYHLLQHQYLPNDSTTEATAQSLQDCARTFNGSFHQHNVMDTRSGLTYQTSAQQLARKDSLPVIAAESAKTLPGIGFLLEEIGTSSRQFPHLTRGKE